jgi:LPXTG-motif cell wall-anchored protein
MLTLVVARGVRYTFWGTMGVLYGRNALALLQSFDAWFAARAPEMLSLAGGVFLAGLAVWLLRRRRAPAPQV